MAFPLGVVAGLTTADFRVLQKGGTGGPPGILAIVPQDEVTARIVLKARKSRRKPGQRSCITIPASFTSDISPAT